MVTTRPITLTMPSLSFLVKALPALSATALASASLPAKPSDLSTPMQVRIAVSGANSKWLDRNPRATKT